MLPNINVTKRHNSVCIQQVRSYVHPIKTENQMGWLKRIRWGRNCQKILLTDVAEQIKPVYKINCSRKKNFDRRITTSIPKKVFCKTGKSCFSQKTRTSRFGTKQVEKVYRRTPPYLTYIGDSIDQGATRLGGFSISIYVCRWGLPFSLGFIIDANSRSL